jgi:hypothetical protein
MEEAARSFGSNMATGVRNLFGVAEDKVDHRRGDVLADAENPMNHPGAKSPPPAENPIMEADEAIVPAVAERKSPPIMDTDDKEWSRKWEEDFHRTREHRQMNREDYNQSRPSPHSEPMMRMTDSSPMEQADSKLWKRINKARRVREANSKRLARMSRRHSTGTPLYDKMKELRKSISRSYASSAAANPNEEENIFQSVSSITPSTNGRNDVNPFSTMDTRQRFEDGMAANRQRENQTRKAQAARRLQAAFRGRRAKNAYTRRQAAAKEFSDEANMRTGFEISPGRIQAISRKLADKQARREAYDNIQREFGAMAAEDAAAAQMRADLKNQNATKIQAMFRGSRAKKAYTRRRTADLQSKKATKIQAFIRGRQTKKAYDQQRAKNLELELAKEFSDEANMRTGFEMSPERVQAISRKLADKQARRESYLTDLKNKKATAIQAAFRGSRAKKAYAKLQADRKNRAATVSNWKSMAARLKQEALNDAASSMISRKVNRYLQLFQKITADDEKTYRRNLQRKRDGTMRRELEQMEAEDRASEEYRKYLLDKAEVDDQINNHLNTMSMDEISYLKKRWNLLNKFIRSQIKELKSKSVKAMWFDEMAYNIKLLDKVNQRQNHLWRQEAAALEKLANDRATKIQSWIRGRQAQKAYTRQQTAKKLRLEKKRKPSASPRFDDPPPATKKRRPTQKKTALRPHQRTDPRSSRRKLPAHSPRYYNRSFAFGAPVFQGPEPEPEPEHAPAPVPVPVPSNAPQLQSPGWEAIVNRSHPTKIAIDALYKRYSAYIERLRAGTAISDAHYNAATTFVRNYEYIHDYVLRHGTMTPEMMPEIIRTINALINHRNYVKNNPSRFKDLR